MERKNNITPFAETTFRNQRQRFGIKREDRFGHMYVIGKTGMGKSNLLLNLIASDLKNGEGLAVFDPHGDLIEDVLNLIPEHRIKETVYIHPRDRPLALNVLEHIRPDQRPLVVSGLISIFKKLWPEFWGPRTEHIFRYSLFALLEIPGTTLLEVHRMLVDEEFQDWVICQVQNRQVRQFWEQEFRGYSKYFRTEAIAPLLNKLGAFLVNPFVRVIVGQVKSDFRIQEVMDQGKILVADLSKGQIGEDVSSLIGSLILTQIYLATLSRQDIPRDKRRDFFVYVDEFQSFSTESFVDLLAQARKYRTGLALSQQHLAASIEKIQDAILGNCGTLICFRVGAKDTEVFAKEFSPVFTEEDLVSLPKYHIYLRLLIDGVASRPFSAVTLGPPVWEKSNGGALIKRSFPRLSVGEECLPLIFFSKKQKAKLYNPTRKQRRFPF